MSAPLPGPISKIMSSFFIPISEGCNRHCTYCIVPHTRGKEKNRNFYEIITEVIFLSKQNTKEIILLGQNVNNFKGIIKKKYKTNLALIIYYINEIKNIKRIRFITSHPLFLSNKILQLFFKIKKLAKSIHIPIQSGSNKILKIMKRGYKIDDYIEKINILKKKNITISTDIIIGFPEENNEDFIKTISIIKYTKFDKSYSFIYNKRKNTLASKMNNATSYSTKKERLKIIQILLNKYTTIINKNMINKKYNILYSKISKNKKYIEGKTENNRIVKIKNNKNKIKNTIKIIIITSKNNSLEGKII